MKKAVFVVECDECSTNSNQFNLMTLICGKSLSEALLFAEHGENMLCTKILFWMSETISVHNMFSPVLSLEFSCIELVIQWTICCLILWVSWWKIRASDKDLLVSQYFWTRYVSVLELIFPLYYLNQLYKVVNQKL